jgi:5'-deoxynucleotidase YfbR-like HD superfamily hydrolase
MEKITKAVDLDNHKIVHDGCMITFSGIVVDLMKPDPETILIADIAHGLANNCRWNGHTQHFWSVAQHCCMMFDKAPYDERLSWLFHDAEEAYWWDMIKPLKNVIRDKCPEILDRMKLMRQIIYKKFEISPLTMECMIADFECLEWEFENIIKISNGNFWLPEQAKKEWLHRYFKVVPHER